MQSKLWIQITDFFFALEEPSNQEIAFQREGEKEQTCVWNVLGNGVLLDGVKRDFPLDLEEERVSNQILQLFKWSFNRFTTLAQKEVRKYGATYKQDSSEQLVKPNKLLLETLLIDKQQEDYSNKISTPIHASKTTSSNGQTLNQNTQA